MRGTIITLSFASLLMLVTGTVMAAENDASELGKCYRDDSAMKREESQQGMFDGVKLTEHQRQQMRDLMRQVRHEQPVYDANDVEIMHRLVTAEKFDAPAVQAQVAKMVQAQIARQVEIARVSNQMYNMLTPEQKSILDQKHEQAMQSVRQQMSTSGSSRQDLELSRQGQDDNTE
ncbi:stress resistance protein [Dickeya dadantii]|uniref:cell-envelope stress modulator CpxP n=1 Tax=Dickeya dadantii TaxID=204038 RepID=UPI00137357F3|nr:cell-envelope stress modulator CpxP [Dickeya dadantii]NAT77535.1 stress resistance protein [Dickeya dadantii]NPE53047.1 stress resistance protein [Dickeya dadantii]NPE65006.1 stress resistance protein [Dickeya dadantii]QWT42587.1 cell-envelope stress modulator CpxP [Dickeya dadantii]